MTHDDDVFTTPRLYDAMRWLCTLGAPQRIDGRAAELLAPYDPTRLLDVGCGTGALTIALGRRFEASQVIGVDPGAAMLDRARRKAAGQGLDIDFRLGHGQRLPLDDDAVDAVTISLALHHVARDGIPDVLAEARRVVRPGGVLLVIELAPVGRLARVLSAHPDEPELGEYAAMTRGAGFNDVRAGRLTPRALGYVIGLAPAAPTPTAGSGATADRVPPADPPAADEGRP